jgi:nucleotide-binding universal stress UspA family protein
MKVLIAMDCSPAADLVLAEAAARPWPKDTSFTVINVVDLHRFAGLPALLEEGKRESDQVAAAVKVSAEPLERAGHHAAFHIIEGFPREAIPQYAKEWCADLVMAGPMATARSHVFCSEAWLRAFCERRRVPWKLCAQEQENLLLPRIR